MNSSNAPDLENDVSDEAWFQKGVTLLESRKQERELEELIKKRMEHPAICEPGFWLGVVFLLATTWPTTFMQEWWIRVPWVLMALFQICGAMEEASKKRVKALLEWIDHQKSKDPESIKH